MVAIFEKRGRRREDDGQRSLRYFRMMDKFELIRQQMAEDAKVVQEIKARISGAENFLAMMETFSEDGSLRLSASDENEVGDTHRRSVLLSKAEIPTELWMSVKRALDEYVISQQSRIDLINAKYAVH